MSWLEASGFVSISRQHHAVGADLQSKEAVKTQTDFRFQLHSNTTCRKFCKNLVANEETKYFILKMSTKPFNLSRIFQGFGGFFAKTKTTKRPGIYYERFQCC